MFGGGGSIEVFLEGCCVEQMTHVCLAFHDRPHIAIPGAEHPSPTERKCLYLLVIPKANNPWQAKGESELPYICVGSTVFNFAYEPHPRSPDPATNPRGIPLAPFVGKVEDYVATRADVEPALSKFQEMVSYVKPIASHSTFNAWLLTNAPIYGTRKYQFMELNTQRRTVSLRDKIPDIQKTLDTVRFLKDREVRVDFRPIDMASVG